MHVCFDLDQMTHVCVTVRIWWHGEDKQLSETSCLPRGILGALRTSGMDWALLLSTGRSKRLCEDHNGHGLQIPRQYKCTSVAVHVTACGNEG